jgi:hypothetical protein
MSFVPIWYNKHKVHCRLEAEAEFSVQIRPFLRVTDAFYNVRTAI